MTIVMTTIKRWRGEDRARARPSSLARTPGSEEEGAGVWLECRAEEERREIEPQSIRELTNAMVGSNASLFVWTLEWLLQYCVAQIGVRVYVCTHCTPSQMTNKN